MTRAQIVTEMERWPAVRDVVRDTGLSQAYIKLLIYQGRLAAARTRLGWLVDPASVAAFERQRLARKAAG